MGATYANVTVRHPVDLQRFWEGEFLVDTGAHDTIVPRKHLEAVGIEPRASREYEMADGNGVRFDLGLASIEIMGEFAGVTVLFGSDDAEPVLGVITMQAVGVELDLRNECLRLGPTKRMTHRRRLLD